MVLAGVLVGLLYENSIAAVLNTEAVQHIAEIILAVLLFVDATEVRGGRLWGGYPGLPWAVLLLIAGVAGRRPHAAGVVIGSLLAWLLNRAHHAGWVTAQSGRLAVLVAPLLTYAATVAIDGNGFVASFVCGTAFRYAHRLLKARRVRDGRADRAEVRADALSKDLHLPEDVTTVLTTTMWFVVGIAAILAFSRRPAA
jgi:NhaP-type Na+/H+ or K+/H+ antiporter